MLNNKKKSFLLKHDLKIGLNCISWAFGLGSNQWLRLNNLVIFLSFSVLLLCLITGQSVHWGLVEIWGGGACKQLPRKLSDLFRNESSKGIPNPPKIPPTLPKKKRNKERTNKICSHYLYCRQKKKWRYYFPLLGNDSSSNLWKVGADTQTVGTLRVRIKCF